MKDLASRILARKRSVDDKAARKAAKNAGKPRITMGKVLKYSLLPGFGKRITNIGNQLGGFAYFLAQIFYSCRLIPAGHPVLQAANVGYFGFSDVIAVAAANLQIRKENTDQILLFSAVVISMLLLVANGLAIAFYTIFDFGHAFAQTANTALNAIPATTTATGGSMFVAPHESTDMALSLLYKAFGVSFFHVGDATGAGPTTMQKALYGMLSTYSTAMMVMAMIIVLYYTFTVVGESAMTGQPFGKRFSTFWAPIRLVVGLGLLVPLGGGLNAAQYLTLYTAKLGSGFASYAWEQFITAAVDPKSAVTTLEQESVSKFVYNILQNEVCSALAKRYSGLGDYSMSGPKDYLALKEFTWGSKGECGTVIVQNTVYSQNTDNKYSLAPSFDFKDAQAGYVEIVKAVHEKLAKPVDDYVSKASSLGRAPGVAPTQQDVDAFTKAVGDAVQLAMNKSKAMYASIDTKFKNTMPQSLDKYTQFGWLGAGMFYNQIADLNGIYVNGMYGNLPKAGTAATISKVDGGGAEVASEMASIMNRIEDITKAAPNPEFALYSKEDAKSSGSGTLNTVLWLMGFGSAEQVVRENIGGKYMEKAMQSSPANAMAVLSTVGADLLAKSAEMFDMAIGSFILQILSTAAMEYAKTASGSFAGIGAWAGGVAVAAAAVLQGYYGLLVTAYILFATTGLMLGVFLYYIVPLLPFIFFFFATLTWILSIVEAMVGLPLWALAHIRIDGDGLSGQAAQNGYMLIFGILLRPFLILFSYLIGMMLFSVFISTLQNMMWNVFAAHGTGYAFIISHIIVSAMYVMLVFIICLLCSKQVDTMPDQVMRWFGSSVPSYNDGQQDPTESIKSATFAAGYVLTQGASQIASSAQHMSSGVSSGFGQHRDIKNTRAAEQAAQERHEDMMRGLGNRGNGGGGNP